MEPCVVIDVFAGTHSTAVAALTCGCTYIGIDNDAAALDVAKYHVPRLLSLEAYKRNSGLFGIDTLHLKTDKDVTL